MSVNVEEIMSGIRAEIQEKGYSSDMLSFADVPADADAGIYVERFDADMLRGNVQYISEHHRVDPYRPLSGNPVAVFFKKVLRKFMSFYVEPYAAEQSSLNANIAQAEQQVELYIRESRMHSTKELLEQTANFLIPIIIPRSPWSRCRHRSLRSRQSWVRRALDESIAAFADACYGRRHRKRCPCAGKGHSWHGLSDRHLCRSH